MSEYRFEMGYGGPRILQFIGWTLVATAAIIELILWGAPGVVPTAAWIVGGAGALGLGCIIGGRWLPRPAFALTGEGLRIGPPPSLVPWSDIASARLGRAHGALQLLASDGRCVASIPTHLPGFDQLVLLLVEAMPPRAASADAAHAGAPSNWGKVVLYGGALWLAIEILLRDGAPPGATTPKQWLGFGMLVAFIAGKAYFGWRGSGPVELRIDRSGIWARDRAGEFSARWEEIEEVAVNVASFHAVDAQTLSVQPTQGRHRRIRLAGMDLLGVLAALRQSAPLHWGRLIEKARPDTIPSGATERPLIQRPIE